jgi:hypothetical protein
VFATKNELKISKSRLSLVLKVIVAKIQLI